MKAGNMMAISLMAGASIAGAGPHASASYTVPTDTNDAAGGHAASTSYSNDASLGGTSGISSVASPVESVKSGYIGQLYGVTALQLTASPVTIDETGTRQFNASQLLDDDTTLAVSATSVIWSVASGPLSGVDGNGLATATAVYQNTVATARGDFEGFTGQLVLTVLDILPDNFGSYAGDGLDDSWQNQFFGLDNPLAAPLMDPDGDGQNNKFEFAAGLIPTNPLSRFILKIEPVPGQPFQKKLIFSPRLEDRTYIMKSRTDLVPGTWLPLTSSTSSDVLDERTVTDMDATGPRKFYRVDITKP